METDPDYDRLNYLQSESSPSDHHPMLKRLKKSIDCSHSPSSPESPEIEPGPVKSDAKLLGCKQDLEREIESDDLDPLFCEGDQTGVKRALDFDDLCLGFAGRGDGLFGDDADSKMKNGAKKKRLSTEEVEDKKGKKKRFSRSSGSDVKPKISKRKEKIEKKAHLEQLADFQRVMRERKGVGFKPVPMVEKPISSVLEKIRQRKLELSKKAMASRTLQHQDSLVDVMFDDDTEENDYVFEVSDPRHGKAVSTKAIAEASYVDINPCASPVKAKSNDKPHLSNERTFTQMMQPLLEETAQPFHPPVNDTQDLFSDSQTSDVEDGQLNEEPSSPAEDIAPSLPSLNLKFDTVLPDDISSEEEESDKDNNDPDPLHLFKGNSSPKGDPVKDFVDEEALEDDSDDDLLKFPDEDEDEDSDMEEIQGYIASDFQEKAVDCERRNELHQMWLQQQDEAGTENLIQKLKYGTEQRELSLLDNEDSSRKGDEESEYDDEDANLHFTSGARPSTKKLKQMIPQMFTDKDDGFVSSEDEETQEILSKERLLQKMELKEQSKFLSPAEDETSREVFSRIKKLNVVPETNKKPKSSTYLNSLMKGGINNSSKSSFLRQASSHPMTSSHRQGPSAGRCFIFGRDDSSSRSSISLSEESSDLSQTEGQVKRSYSAKFISSQAKWSTQHTEIIRSETVPGTSLFEILKRSSMQAGHVRDDRDNLINDQAVYAAFKSVKKLTKIERK